MYMARKFWNHSIQIPTGAAEEYSLKWEIYSGNTLSPANLSNEYNRMFFLIFHFLENRPLECCFLENKPLECRFPENKMDNSQNGYSSVGKTGKIKKMVVSFFNISNKYIGT